MLASNLGKKRWREGERGEEEKEGIGRREEERRRGEERRKEGTPSLSLSP